MWWHLRRGAATFLWGKLGESVELNAGHGGLSSCEGKSKGDKSTEGSTRDVIISHSLTFSSFHFLFCWNLFGQSERGLREETQGLTELFSMNKVDRDGIYNKMSTIVESGWWAHGYLLLYFDFSLCLKT